MKGRLFLIFHGRFPGEKAASLFAAKSAEAFAAQGLEVTVVVPKRAGVDASKAYEYFGVPRTFSIVEIPTVGIWPILKKLSFWLSYWSFARGAAAYLRPIIRPEDIVYSNETLPLLAASKLTSNIFYEMHDFPESKLGLFKRFLGKVRWLLVHNQWKAARIKESFGFPTERILYEPNAVDPGDFDIDMSVEEARNQLGLPLDKKLVVYTGHLYGWKGVDTLARAAELLSPDYLAAFVGGTAADVAKFKERYATGPSGKSDRLLIVGHRPHKEIPVWQKAADVLVLPNTAKEKISAYYTSPMKLFEYMASGKPIVASDIPSIREIVGEDSAYLVAPDDEAALAGGIIRAASDAAGARSRADKARSLVESRTWQKRAERILDFIRS